MISQIAYTRLLGEPCCSNPVTPAEPNGELLAALPTINEQQMVPEGFAAVVLLQESVRQRKTDPQALSELRQYLQTSN